MGLIATIFEALFGGGRNGVRDTIEVFRENTEKAAVRDAVYRGAALEQFAGEFRVERKGRFDRFMDGLNRLPRPAMALGTLGLFVSAMVDPVWFAQRMQGIALVPQPLWWLLGAVVSFYFGARHQIKAQEFRRSIADTMSRAAQVSDNIAALRALDAGAGFGSRAGENGAGGEFGPAAGDELGGGANAALDDWRRGDEQ